MTLEREKSPSVATASKTLALFRKAKQWDESGRLFSLGICLHAPYFASIFPRMVDLRPGRCEVIVKKRWPVLNHLKTVHAIASCNAAELAAGVLMEASLSPKLRWIPVGMTVEYLLKAESDIRAVASVSDEELETWTTKKVVKIPVSITDVRGNEVVKAVVSMRISPRPSSKL